MSTFKSAFFAVLLISLSMTSLSAAAQQTAPQSPADPAASSATEVAGTATTMDDVVNRAILREHALMDFLKSRNPLVETYLQDLKKDDLLGETPKSDHYFLGRLDMGEAVDRRDYLSTGKSMEKNLLGGVTKLFKVQYSPTGFSWMIFVDRQDFDRNHYDFKYVQREFLGDIRCLVFDVSPKKDAGKGRFLGRIWIEDQNYNIVRLNGTYAPRPKGSSYFFHMDSWRLNLVPGYWLPAYIYSEEGDFSYGTKSKINFKAQTRIWGYNLKNEAKEDELTQLRVDSVKDDSASAQDASPLEARREWQQQADDNVVARLEQAGLLAPEGDIDKILQTVVNNLIITNNIELPQPVRTRLMLTSPLETFSVGNTIVVSRGLIDVLPDEASLAIVLSHELAHIVLGHNIGGKYAFSDRMLFSDEATYRNFGFRHSPEEDAAADAKAIELLKNSPYAQKMDTGRLFLKQLAERAPSLGALLTSRLGDSFVDEKGNMVRMVALTNSGPALDIKKLDQIAALPLGGRVKVNPWNDQAELEKSAPVAITTARDKMPFEVAPFFPHLSRLNSTDTAGSTTAAANTSSH
ncbi:MAG: M48 family metalloprotease [Terriglobales bacterium]